MLNTPATTKSDRTAFGCTLTSLFNEIGIFTNLPLETKDKEISKDLADLRSLVEDFFADFDEITKSVADLISFDKLLRNRIRSKNLATALEKNLAKDAANDPEFLAAEKICKLHYFDDFTATLRKAGGLTIFPAPTLKYIKKN